jgi:hypothetical protein
MSDCQPLNTIDYSALLNMSLDQALDFVGLEKNLAQAYYQIEARRHPDSFECQRLIA